MTDVTRLRIASISVACEQARALERLCRVYVVVAPALTDGERGPGVTIVPLSECYPTWEQATAFLEMFRTEEPKTAATAAIGVIDLDVGGAAEP
jgi:hypothetical protein